MKNAFAKIVSSLIILSLVGSNALLALPTKAEAQGAASSCIVGYALGLTSAATGAAQEIIGVPVANLGRVTSGVVNSGSANALSFNNCVLKPLGTMIAVAFIRNIGSSIVDWVNSGFNGSPSFITDLGGTLLDAADQAVGQLIEGSELGWLCSDFSFQIRIALALKYSKPFKREVACTLSKIGDNANNFIENNGGAGWDNWLQITTQPNNNVYGAYLIADSELAQRALTKVDQKYKTISFGSGFDSLETCDEYESPSEAQARYAQEVSSPTNTGASGFDSSSKISSGGVSDFGNGSDSIQTRFDGQSVDFSGNTLSASGATAASNQTFSNGGGPSIKPQCKPGKKFIGTPGATIAHKLDSVLGQGEIQAAVAQEIDQVIAAVLNQIVQTTLQAAGGLLGSSKKGSTGSYIKRYQAQYYGEATSTVGAQSPIDSYRVISYTDAAALRSGSGNPTIQEINNLTNSTIDSASSQINEQFNTVQENANSQDGSKNVALLKTASQSSGSNQGAANDGIKTSGKYMNGSATINTDNKPWWEVDLEKSYPVDSVRVWKLTKDDKDKQADDGQTLGTFRVLVSEDRRNYWTSDWIDGSIIQQPMVVPVNQTGRYVKIEKKPGTFSFKSDGRTFYYPLELAEVEVMAQVDLYSGSTATSTSPGGGSGTTDTSGPTTPTTARVSIEVPSAPVIVRTGTSDAVSVPVYIRSNISTTIPRIEMDFTLNDRPVRFDSLFIGPTVELKVAGVTRYTTVDSNSQVAFEGTPAGGNNDTKLTITAGRANFVQKGTTYKLKITTRDATGTTGEVTATAMIDFVVE